jgi:WD40 repeat protein
LIVDSNTGKHKQLLPGYHGLPGLTWLADGQTLVGLQTEDGLLSAVNVKSGKIAFSIDAFVVPNSSPILAKWGENELTTYNGVELLRWDALTGRLIGHTPSSLPIDWPVESCLNRETSADQRFHLQYTSRPEVKTDGTGVEIPVLAVTDQNGKKIVAQFEGGPDRGRDRSDWSPDGKRIVSGDSLGISSTVVWDAQTGKLLMELGSPFGGKLPYIGDLVWSPDGQFIAGGEGVLGSAGEDHGFVVIWNGQTGQPVRVFTDGVQNRRINCLAWSPDGTRLAAGLVSGQVMVWEATSGQPVALLEGHVDQVMGLNWSPDSRRIAANAIDRAVFVWNLP